MKKLLYLTLLALPLLMLPSKALAWGCDQHCCLGGCTIDYGFNWHYSIKCGCPGQCGPWYLYWPYEAHFAAAAPVGGPCFPAWGPPGGMAGMGAPTAPMMGLPGAMGSGGAPMAPMMGVPGAQPMAPIPGTPPPASIQPTVYSGQVPAYWYGR